MRSLSNTASQVERFALRRAFSLAEMMIALVILGLGLLFIAAALPAGLEYSRATVDSATADEAAQHAMELIVQGLRTSKRLSAEPSDPTSSVLLYQVGKIPRLDGIFRPRRTVDDAGVTTLDPRLWSPLRFAPFLPTTVASVITSFPSYFGGAFQTAILDYEPYIKVRPLTMANIAMTNASPVRGYPVIDNPDTAIEDFLFSGIPLPPGGVEDIARTKNIVATPSQLQDYDLRWDSAFSYLSLAENLSIPAIARTFPPVSTQAPYRASDFFADAADYRTFLPPTRDSVKDTGVDAILEGTRPAERTRALDQRIGVVVFYRRVAYTERTLINPSEATAGEEFYSFKPADPLTYEIIVVVTRRPTASHRYAVQDTSARNTTAFEEPEAIEQSAGTAYGTRVGSDRLFPVPWLISFDSSIDRSTALSIPDDSGTPGEFDSAVSHQGTASDRALNLDNNSPSQFTPPGKLVFKLRHSNPAEPAKADALLPVGSIIIPATNDDHDWNANARASGFVPHAPTALPIYEVVERPDSETVVVKDNGLYPWVAKGLTAANFPCWVIPPSFAERGPIGTNSARQPIFDRKSPVVSVLRRVVRLPEVQ